MAKLEVNDQSVSIDVPDDTPLLWVVREELGLKGAKFGCGKGICGACTMHLNGTPIRTCILPVSAAQGQQIATIESMETKGLHPVQQAWIKHSVPQCGYCQSGQIMQAIGLLESKDSWTEADLLAGMANNLCRCGTYNKIKAALLDAARQMGRLA